jgi:hypothetical protein
LRLYIVKSKEIPSGKAKRLKRHFCISATSLKKKPLGAYYMKFSSLLGTSLFGCAKNSNFFWKFYVFQDICYEILPVFYKIVQVYKLTF